MPEKSILEKYARLLVNYCLEVKHDDKVYITASYLAEPLLREVVTEVYKAGGHPVINVELNLGNANVLTYGDTHQLQWINPARKIAMETFDCYLNIRAPFEKGDDEKEPLNTEKYQIFQEAH